MPTTSDHDKQDEQYNKFLTATSHISSKLKIDPAKVTKNRGEHRAGSFYYSTGEGDENTFCFWFTADRKDDEINRVLASVEIYYNEFSARFEVNDDITANNHGNYLSKWADWVIYSFNQHRNSGGLDALFDNMPIKVYGLPNDMDWTEPELIHFINGINAQPQKVLIYKFRHIDPDTKYRSFSYAFFQGSFWVFFLVVGGLDSGGAHCNLDRVEELIENINVPTYIKNKDIDYYELKEFLARRVAPFEPERKGEITFKLDEVNADKFGARFSGSYSKFLINYENEDYVQALRNLRALLQTAMEIICEQRSFEIDKKSDINKLCSLLVKEKIIDKEMVVWYCAFTSVANTPSHKDYSPTGDDFSDEQLRTAILVGTQLIAGLEDAVEDRDC